MIKGVLFDLGDTLVTSWGTAEIYQRIFKEKDIKKTLKQIEKAHEKGVAALKKKYKSTELLAMNVDEFYTSWNEEVLKQLKITDSEMAEYVHRRWFDAAELRVFDDSIPVLNRLSAMGLRLGIVTNGFMDEVKDVFRITGLKPDMFTIVVGRDTLYAVKPDPRPFHHAAGSMGLRPDEVIFVGDKFDKDYEGSQGVGMTPVLLLRGRPLPPGAPENINTAETLDEIVNFIQ